jgi:DNA-binding response OmpR family regulator
MYPGASRGVVVSVPIAMPETLRALRVVRVLLVHTEAAERERLARDLIREGLRVRPVATHAEALRVHRVERPDVVLLDSQASSFDPLDLCRTLREHAGSSGTRLVLLGSRVDDPHVAAVYSAGADGYVPLPCASAVLALRLKALVRTGANGVAGPESLHARDQALELGAWVLDPETHEVRATVRSTAGGTCTERTEEGAAEVVPVTRAEFRLLYLLASNAGRTVPTERLREYAGVARVRSHVSRLRRKLGLPPSGPGAIEAQEGVGYRYLPAAT